MAQGRSTKIISMIEWIRTSRLPIMNSLSAFPGAGFREEASGTRHNGVGNTDGAAVGGSKFAAAASKVAGAPLGSCRFVSMDATE